MIAGNAAIRDIQKEGMETSQKMTISQDNEVQSHIIKVLTENYKYPIASLIREGVSNAWDSHVMSNKIDTPIPVKLFKDKTGNYTLEIIDEGLGLDEEGFYKYYMKLGESNKRGVAGVLGYYGCGAKSALAYTDSYEVICRKDGIERAFLIYKGEDTPECTKIYEKDVVEPNGVKIKVPVSRWDFNDFVKAIKQQLCYFPTAAIEIENDGFNYLEAKIFENELFSWSEIYPSSEMHINFGGVHYPIDWDLMKMSKINIPVGIKIAPDKGVNPFFNRESLQYTTLTKETIKEQINKVANYFIEKYNESVPDERDLIEAWEDIGKQDKYVEIAGKSFHINSLIIHSNIKPKELKIKGLSLKDPQYYMSLSSKYLNNYDTIVDYTEPTWRAKRLYRRHNVDHLFEDKKLIVVNQVPTRKLKTYLLEKHKGKLFFIKKTQERALGSVKYVNRNEKNYLYTLGLGAHKDKSKWRPLIKEFQYVESHFLKLLIDETNCENTEEYQKWLVIEKERVKAHRKQYGTSGNYKGLNKGELDITIAYYQRKYKWKKELHPKKAAYEINKLNQNKFLTVYQSLNNPSLYDFEALAQMFPKVKFALIGKNEVKKLPKIHNFKTIEEFMSQLTKPFIKVVTANKVNSVLDTYNDLVDNEIVEKILIALHNDIEILQKYVEDNYCNMDEEVSNSIYEYAKENNIWDREIMAVVNKVEKGLQDYEFISILQEPTSYNAEEVEKYQRFINQMLLFKKLYNNKSLPEYELILKPKPVFEEELVLEEV